MLELNVVGKQVSIEGHGTEHEPFIVHGIKKNPALVAGAEEAMIDHWMSQGNWEMVKTRLEHCPKGRVLAILTVLTTDEESKPIKGDIWFDVTEAFGEKIAHQTSAPFLVLPSQRSLYFRLEAGIFSGIGMGRPLIAT